MADFPGFQRELHGSVEGSSRALLLLIDDLPDECLIPILKNIPTENMDDVTMVCQRWDKVIQENIGLEIWASDVGFRIAHRFFNDLADVEKYTISSLKSRVTEELFPQLKNPESLQVLELASQTTIETFRTLTDHTINLKELHFGYGSLTLEDISTVPLYLPNLEVLNIMDRSFESRDLEAPEKMSKNIIGVLNTHFPSIKSIVLSTVATRRLTEQYGVQFLRFLQKNRSTIKRVKINIGTAIQRQPLQDYGSLDHSVVLDKDISNTLNWDQSPVIRLDELDIDFGLNYFVGMEQWRQILSKQDMLVHINCSLGKPLPVFVTKPAVMLSASSLVTIQLGLEVYRSDHPKTPVDCSIFETCLNLKMLVLVGNVYNEDRPISKELFNTQKLPKSIEAVAVQNMFMIESDIESLFMEIPDLKKVALENVGCDGEFGVTFPLLNKILDHRQLPEIIIKGINGDECQLHYYDNLIKLGLRLPINESTLFHVTFFPHFMEYVFAGEC